MAEVREVHLEGIENALKHSGGTHALNHVLAAVHEGRAQMWIDGDSVIVTEVNDTPLERVLHFWLAAGALDEVLPLSNKVLEWGRALGCTVATLQGRKGWSRALLKEGWDEVYQISMGRRLDG